MSSIQYVLIDMALTSPAASQSGQRSQYNGDDYGGFDYASQPRAHAHAVAYGGVPEDTRHSSGQHYRDNAAADFDTGDAARRFSGADTYRNDYATGPNVSEPDVDTHTNYDNDDGWSPPSRPFSKLAEVEVPWGQQAGQAGATYTSGATRRRSPSDVSYEGEPDMAQGPSQRRRTTQSPSSPARQRSSSPPLPDGASDEPEPDPDEEEDTDEQRARRDYPKAQRVVDYGPGKRGKQGDYEQEAQQIMNLAVVMFKGMMMSDHAYPGKLTDRVWATTAWYQAADRLNVELAPTPEVLRLVCIPSLNSATC